MTVDYLERKSTSSGTPSTAGPIRWRSWGLPVVAALVLTPLALVAHSYKYVNDDQILYIPFLRRKIEPALYPGDYFFDQAQAGISLFEDVLVWPVRLLGIEWTMLLGYLLAQALILLCLYFLAKRLTSQRTAYLAMVLFILPVSIGGTFVRTYDNYFNPRTFALPLGLLTLIALWERRPWWAAGIASLHLLLHPLSGLHTWLVAVLLLVWWALKGRLPLRSLIGPGAVLLGTLGVLVWGTGGSEALWLDPAWRDVLWRRTPYVFLQSWKSVDWISLGLYLFLGIIGWVSRPRGPRTTQLCLAMLVVVLGSTLAVAVGADWLGLAPLAQLQLARSWRLVIVLAVIFGADLVFVLFERWRWGGTLVAALLGVAIYFDRADAEWQPVFVMLLAALLLAWALEYRSGARTSRGSEVVLVLAGLGLVLPTLLVKWSVVDNQLLAFADRWRLPEKALWPVILVFGLALAVKNLHRKRNGALAKWVMVGVGSALTLVALLTIGGDWRQRDWSEYLDDRLQLPVSDTWMSSTFLAWRDVQMWAEGHTHPAARFATDPDEKGFRVFSQRSPIVEEKDGASAMFSRSYAMEWDRRMQAMSAAGVVDLDDKETEFTSFSVEGLEALHRLHAFDYVVGQQPQDLPWPEVYRNQVFVVFAWPGEAER